ncbi:VOC family protein [Paenibacillus protaetiae]|uniref:VOC family protein n=1 Tax=Paenibacillus protaetiae TaxID=2509456 RepID=A0A4V0YF73_9BACL|nr:VOC family protein [Paenibacillus protaetiae]QAY66711.1 VOC family protein [Paenibacillus protaetiae]
MAVKKIEHLGIMVSDIERSVAFYTEVLGLKHVKTMLHNDGVIRLAFLAFPEAGETILELVEGYNGPVAAEGRVHHAAFTVDDLDAELARIKSLDVNLRDTEITTLPDGARYFFFYGPDGELLELFEPVV